LSVRRRQSKQSVAAKQRTPFRRERDGAARFRAVPVVIPRYYAFATHSRLRGYAGRSYPSHSTSHLYEIMGARRTTRTRQAHAVSRWHRSRTGMSLPCVPKYLSTLAHSDGKRASRSSLATRAQKRPLPADLCGLVSPQAACSLCVTQGMHARSWRLLDCAWKAAAGGTSVRYHRDRAIPTTTAAQNGLLGQLVPMRRVRTARVLG
jgi:hypothetical protein